MAGSTEAVTYVTSNGAVYSDPVAAFNWERRALLKAAIDWDGATEGYKDECLDIIMAHASQINEILNKTIITVGVAVPSSTQGTRK